MGLSHSPRIVTNGLVLVLDAANPKSYPGSGTAFNDLSGNGKHFAWDAQPTFVSAGGASYINTNGRFATGPASDSFGLTGSSGYTVIFLMQQITKVDHSAFLFSRTGTGGGNRGISAHISLSGSLYFDQGGCCGSDTRTNIDTDTTSSWCMISLRRETNSSNRSIIRNTTTLITNTSAAADISLISEPAYINRNPNHSWNGTWDAKLGMMLTYNRGLSDVEITQNFNALRGRYGI